jgi:type I restriction enzyme S subunit
MKLTVDPGKADGSYVYYACTSEPFIRQVLDNAVAAGVPHINLGTLRALTIPLPTAD